MPWNDSGPPAFGREAAPVRSPQDAPFLFQRFIIDTIPFEFYAKVLKNRIFYMIFLIFA